jgi:hypothetical protein
LRRVAANDLATAIWLDLLMAASTEQVCFTNAPNSGEIKDEELLVGICHCMA